MYLARRFKLATAIALAVPMLLQPAHAQQKLVRIPIQDLVVLGVSVGLNVAPTSLDFGTVTPGLVEGPLAVTITNAGSAPAGVAVSTSPPFSVTSNCGTSLASSASCTLETYFAPVKAGAASGVVSVSSGATTSTIALTGFGASYQAQVNPSAMTFANMAVGSTSLVSEVTLSNTGSLPLSLGAATATAPFGVQSTNCGASVAAGSSCTYDVTFSPTTMGAASGALSIPTNAGVQTVALSGYGQQTAGTLSLGSLAFGDQNVGTASAAEAVALDNTGNTPLGITRITSTGDFKVTQNCGTNLAAGANCAINVVFAPTTMGTQTGALTTVTSGGTYSVSLSGNGVEAVVTASPSAVVFGNQNVNTTSGAQTVTLANSGNLATSVASASATAPFQIVSNTCGSSLAAGSSCTYKVTFAPTTAGAQSGTLTVVTGAGTYTASLSGTAAPSTVGDGVSNTGACTGGAVAGCAVFSAATSSGVSLSGGNRTVASSGSFSYATSNTCRSSGKWYFEFTRTSESSPASYIIYGEKSAQSTYTTGNYAPYQVSDNSGTGYYDLTGDVRNSASANVGNLGNIPVGGTLGVAINADAGVVTYMYGGKSVTVSGVVSSNGLCPSVGYMHSGTVTLNAGQSNFVMAPPAGYNMGMW